MTSTEPRYYTDRVVIRRRLPHINANAFGYYTIINKSPVMAGWIFSRLLPHLTNGEMISLWTTNEDGGQERIRSFEKKVTYAT